MTTRAAWFALAAVASVFGCHEDPTIAGTYLVSGELELHAADGGITRTAIAGETVPVTLKQRYDQGAQYEITLGGCTFWGDGSASTAGLHELQPCDFRGLGAGTDLHVVGSVRRKNSGIELVLNSTSDGGTPGSILYAVEGPPKP